MEMERPNPKPFEAAWLDHVYSNTLRELSEHAQYMRSDPADKSPSTLRFSNPRKHSFQNLNAYFGGKYVISISSSRDIDEHISQIDKELLIKHMVNADSIDISWHVPSPKAFNYVDYDSISLVVHRSRVTLTRDMTFRKGARIKTSTVYTTAWNNENLEQPSTHADPVYFDNLDRPIKSVQTRTVKGTPTKEDPNPKESIMTLEQSTEYFNNIRKTEVVCRLDGFEKARTQEITIANDDGVILKYISAPISNSVPIGESMTTFTLKRGDTERIMMCRTKGNRDIDVRRIPYNFDSDFTADDIATLCTIINPKFNDHIKYLSILTDDKAGIPTTKEDD